jgi:hypothetical protein
MFKPRLVRQFCPRLKSLDHAADCRRAGPTRSPRFRQLAYLPGVGHSVIQAIRAVTDIAFALLEPFEEASGNSELRDEKWDVTTRLVGTH